MKRKLLILITLFTFTLGAFAQNAAQARKLLDRTAALVGRKGGASANFSISGNKVTATSGTLAIKGAMFNAHTPKATIWYNGKTQWTYMKSTNEVNVSKPTEAKRMQMNPLTFLSMYKNGYTLSMSSEGNNKVVHMTAQNKQRTVQEVYITINPKTAVPSKIRMRDVKKNWTTITISNFQAKNQSTKSFSFNAKDFPSAEIVDLR